MMTDDMIGNDNQSNAYGSGRTHHILFGTDSNRERTKSFYTYSRLMTKNNTKQFLVWFGIVTLWLAVKLFVFIYNS
jgi:hypothetical protein